MSIEITPGHGPLYRYSVRTVSDLLLCLKPHNLRGIREDLSEIESEFEPDERRPACELMQFIDELLIALDGDVPPGCDGPQEIAMTHGSIDNDVPLPPELPNAGITPILANLEPGQSVVFHAERSERLSPYASELKRKTGRKFTMRKIAPGQIRVWRVS